MRAAVQERKAVLCWELHQLLRRPPPELGAATIQGTRAWLARFKAARSVKANPRASARELRETIERVRSPFPGRVDCPPCTHTCNEGRDCPASA